jgi:type 1 glutamine amidotransferase
VAGRRPDVSIAAIALLLIAACSSSTPSSPQPPPGGTPRIRVLMVTTTAGFRHDSIAVARETMTAMCAASTECIVTPTEDVGMLSTGSLANFDVVFFALTTGELPLSADQKSAILSFVQGGKGFMGAHSATDTLYDWPEYESLVGARFKEHPWTQAGTVIVEDQSHPATTNLGANFTITEEFYTFRDNPRPRVQVLLRLDAGSVGATGDFPLAWSDTLGTGRVYYNALGHFSETWRDQRFQQQLSGAIRWVGRR